MLHKAEFIVPTPGSRKLERIQENLGAADVDLTDEEYALLETELAKIDLHGNRTDEDIAELREHD
jgi:aryl-alcohol dehydrogenase-like predicted oxidoreductase